MDVSVFAQSRIRSSVTGLPPPGVDVPYIQLPELATLVRFQLGPASANQSTQGLGEGGSLMTSFGGAGLYPGFPGVETIGCPIGLGFWPVPTCGGWAGSTGASFCAGVGFAPPVVPV